MKHNKSYTFTKKSTWNEAKMYRLVSQFKEIKCIPKFYSYNSHKQMLITQRINNMCIADIYGEEFDKVPDNIIIQIKHIIKQLADRNIMYPDITGYNFIEDSLGKVWIIDFEHCFHIQDTQNKNYLQSHIEFISNLISGVQGWNNYFK